MKRERNRWLGLWVVTVVVAGWLGTKLGKDDAAGEAASQAGGDARSGQLGGEPRLAERARGDGGRGLGADELRALVREELDRADELRQERGLERAPDAVAAVEAAGDATGEAAEAAPADHGAPPPSPEEKAQRVSDALAVVQGAVTSGQWRNEERQRFAAAAQRLPAAELFEVTRQLNIAINRGQISIPDGLPPYGPSALLH